MSTLTHCSKVSVVAPYVAFPSFLRRCVYESAHIGRWRSEWLWSLWIDQAILVVFVGVANCGLIAYVLAAASYSLDDFFCTIPDSEADNVKKPKAARRCSNRFKCFLLLFQGGLFHFLYTRCCTCVVVAVSAQPTEIMSECFFVSDCIFDKVLECSCASFSCFFAGHDEVLKGAIDTETASTIQVGCTPGGKIVHELALADYAVWFTDILN